MAIKPILFNTEMVRAILDGRKSCTRRIIKPQWEECPHCKYVHKEYIYGKLAENVYCAKCGYPLLPERRAPYQPGDILYVRETWQYLYELEGNEQIIEDTGKYYYAATDTISFNTYVDENGLEHEHVPWKPSIHMPKEAARIWLKVTDVRIERLQDVTEDGAKAEGAIDNRGFIHSPENEYDRIHTAREHFIKIWNSTIKKPDINHYGWNVNPWFGLLNLSGAGSRKECEKCLKQYW